MKWKHHRRVILTVVADLPADIPARLFGRAVWNFGGRPIAPYSSDRAVENWTGSDRPDAPATRGERELPRLIFRYIALQARLAEVNRQQAGIRRPDRQAPHCAPPG